MRTPRLRASTPSPRLERATASCDDAAFSRRSPAASPASRTAATGRCARPSSPAIRRTLPSSPTLRAPSQGIQPNNRDVAAGPMAAGTIPPHGGQQQDQHWNRPAPQGAPTAPAGEPLEHANERRGENHSCDVPIRERARPSRTGTWPRRRAARSADRRSSLPRIAAFQTIFANWPPSSRARRQPPAGEVRPRRPCDRQAEGRGSGRPHDLGQ